MLRTDETYCCPHCGEHWSSAEEAGRCCGGHLVYACGECGCQHETEVEAQMCCIEADELIMDVCCGCSFTADEWNTGNPCCSTTAAVTLDVMTDEEKDQYGIHADSCVEDWDSNDQRYYIDKVIQLYRDDEIDEDTLRRLAARADHLQLALCELELEDEEDDPAVPSATAYAHHLRAQLSDEDVMAMLVIIHHLRGDTRVDRYSRAINNFRTQATALSEGWEEATAEQRQFEEDRLAQVLMDGQAQMRENADRIKQAEKNQLFTGLGL